MLPAIAVTLSADDRQRALDAAAEAANPNRGRTVFLQTLAIAAFQQLWSWLEFGPDCPAINGLPGEVGRVGLAQGGSIALLPLTQEAPDPGGTEQPPPPPVDWPLDWPDDVVAFVPVAVNHALDRACLWGWVSVGDLNLPPAPAQPSLGNLLQNWESLEPYLWRMTAALAWIAEAADPVALQVRQSIAPDERMALVASLDRQYREGDPMGDLTFGLSSLNLDDTGERLESDISEDSLPENSWLLDPEDQLQSDLRLPDSPRNNTPLTYGSPTDRPTAKVRDPANPYRAKTDHSKASSPTASNPSNRAWQDLEAPLLERLLPIWERQADYIDTDADAHFSDELEDLLWDLQIDRLDLDADEHFDETLGGQDDRL
ncbi:MAG: DUF1822 family protein [Oscillatoriales cyanobacterium]|nr:MAG: DUF1822 family protein [Oscillatoriales cyanobacterium]